jgi:DNA end-binding protein Ku
MASTIWSGVIGFGMVSIPVKLYAATSSKRVAFHQLHAKCNTRIKEIRWCPTCDREVPWEEVVKGYSLSKDESIPITEEDFEKLPLPSKNIIDIASFAQLEEVDPLFYDKNYYLLPDKQGQRAFNLFIKAIETKSLVAIGKIAIRSRERLCAIRGLGGTLILSTLLYQDEVKVETDEKPAAAKIPKAELDMALNLVDMMTAPFNPADFKDDYQDALNQLIEAKLSGKGAKKQKALKPAAVADLMEALKASVSNVTRGGAKGGGDRSTRSVKVKKGPAAKTAATSRGAKAETKKQGRAKSTARTKTSRKR